MPILPGVSTRGQWTIFGRGMCCGLCGRVDWGNWNQAGPVRMRRYGHSKSEPIKEMLKRMVLNVLNDDIEEELVNRLFIF